MATPEQAPALLTEMVGRAEAAIAALGLPYRTIDICTGDLGQSHHRSFDVEVYAPGVDAWLEVSSVSWFSDYQARRANIRYRPATRPATREGHRDRPHAERLGARRAARVAAIVENFRQPDGSVRPARGAAAVPARRRAHRAGAMTTADELRSRRVQYETAGLDVADVAGDPLGQWQRWYEDASAAGVAEPNAMVIATAGADGRPDARFVLVRGVDERGVVFFTNLRSVKSRQLADNPIGRRRVRLARPAPPGARPRAGRTGHRGGERRLPRVPAAGQPDRGVGVAAERGGGRPRRPRSAGRRGRRPGSTASTSPARRSGAAGAWSSRRPSSGRVARAASTTACATAAAPAASGSSSASRPEDRRSHGGFASPRVWRRAYPHETLRCPQTLGSHPRRRDPRQGGDQCGHRRYRVVARPVDPLGAESAHTGRQLELHAGRAAAGSPGCRRAGPRSSRGMRSRSVTTS